MNIRKMTIEDYETVYALWLSCKGMGLNSVDDTPQAIGRFLDRNPETCFVAVEAEVICGVILAGNDGRRGYLYHVAVHPEHRRKGIATALVDLVIEKMREIGISKIGLLVFEHNADGNTFWEEMGFCRRNDVAFRNRLIMEVVRMDT